MSFYLVWHGTNKPVRVMTSDILISICSLFTLINVLGAYPIKIRYEYVKSNEAQIRALFL